MEAARSFDVETFCHSFRATLAGSMMWRSTASTSAARRTRARSPCVASRVAFNRLRMLLARCDLRGSRLHVRSVVPARDLPQGGLSPAEATRGVRRELLGRGPVVVGVDAPPSIARRFLGAMPWRRWLGAFRRVYPTAEIFKEKTTVKGKELKRVTDVRHQTPLAPQNLRMYKQTWWAINGIFSPLAAQGFSVVPCMDLSDKLLMESCPASLLKRLQLYSEPYKGRTERHRHRRGVILKTLKLLGTCSLRLFSSLKNLGVGRL